MEGHHRHQSRPPVVVDKIEVRVDGPGATDPLFQRITADPPLHAGDRLSHATYEAIKSDLQRTAATYGYLDAKLNSQRTGSRSRKPTRRTWRWKWKQASAIASVHHHRADLGQDALVRRYLRYHQGGLFRPDTDPADTVRAGRRAILRQFEVLPQDADHQTHVIPVDIHADKSRRNRYSFGAGYATDTGGTRAR